MPIFAKLSDIYGRKWFLLAGSAGFVVTSALCGAAGKFSWLGIDGMNQLIVFRAMQGICGGMMMGLTFTIIGFSILLPFCLQRLFRNSRAAALTALLFLVVCFAGWSAVREPAEQTDDVSTGLAHWLRTADVLRLPIVVADPLTYLPLAHNAANELGEKFCGDFGVVQFELSQVEQIGTDQFDFGIQTALDGEGHSPDQMRVWRRDNLA